MSEGASAQSEGCCGVANNMVKEHIIAPSTSNQPSLTKDAAALPYPWRHWWGSCSNSSHMSWVNPLLRGGESQKQEVRGSETGQTWSALLSDIQFPSSALTDFPSAFSELKEKAVPTLKSLRRSEWASDHSTKEALRSICLMTRSVRGPGADLEGTKTATSSGGGPASWTHRW